jgi:hypothetical protein
MRSKFLLWIVGATVTFLPREARRHDKDRAIRPVRRIGTIKLR